MSALRVGTRVKRVRRTVSSHAFFCPFSPNVPVGSEGVIVSPSDFSDPRPAGFYVRWDNVRSATPHGLYYADAVDIEPILRTPDAAEILSMQNLPEGPVREREYVNAR